VPIGRGVRGGKRGFWRRHLIGIGRPGLVSR